MPAKVVLRVIAGPLKGRRFEFHEHDTFLCGRHPSCHAMLPNDKYVSRHHFLLEVNPPAVTLRDLGSRNGTLVNDLRIGGRQAGNSAGNGNAPPRRQVDLTSGDRVVVGKTEIHVQIQVPLCCQGCGAELPEVRPPESAGTVANYCGSCREPPARSALHQECEIIVQCEYCGKNADGELGHGQSGSYVCQECQAMLLTQPGGLRQLMLEAAKQRDTGSMLEIPDHEIRHEIGKGGMGAVYMGVRRQDQRRVAVKILLAKIAVSETARQQFVREVKVTEQLRHENIVRFLGSGGFGSTFYLLLTARHPRDSSHGRDPVEVVLQEDAVPIRKRDSAIPAPFAAVINQALAARAEDRFQTAGEMKSALLRALKLGE